MTFDFDYWAKLYKKDPERFNRERLDLLRKAAEEKCPKKSERIMAMVNGWDMKLSRIKNPISRQAELEKLFAQQITKFIRCINGNN